MSKEKDPNWKDSGGDVISFFWGLGRHARSISEKSPAKTLGRAALFTGVLLAAVVPTVIHLEDQFIGKLHNVSRQGGEDVGKELTSKLDDSHLATEVSQIEEMLKHNPRLFPELESFFQEMRKDPAYLQTNTTTNSTPLSAINDR